ncbi:MAG: FlgD immunoglobulin-like domain containing protein [Fibrobacterota bacterium]
MSRFSPLIFCCLLAFSFADIFAAAVFTGGPTAISDNGNIRIDFSVSEATDVAVWVEDDQGKITSHLAAGNLASSTVPAPLQAGLVQSILWDGKDDNGNTMSLAGKTVKVGLGISASFDKVIGWDGLSLGCVLGLAVDSAGSVYVLNGGGDYWSRSSPTIQVLDRSGNYTRTLLPYPGNVTLNTATQNLWRNSTLVGWVPRIHQFFQTLYPEANQLYTQTMCVAGDRLVFSNTGSKSKPHQLRIKLNGQIPDQGFIGTEYYSGVMNVANIHFAFDSDSNWIYATGFLVPGEWSTAQRHVVYRSKADDAAPVVFSGVLDTAGTDNAHFNNPSGMDVDDLGNVYVADKGNSRICVFNSAGVFLASLAVTSPGPIAVHPDGRIYVVSSSSTLLKYASYSASSPSAQIALRSDGLPTLGLDRTAASAIVWAGFMSTVKEGGKGELWKLTDQGASFAKEVIASFTPNVLVRPMYIAADNLNEQVYVKDWADNRVIRISGINGVVESVPFVAADMEIGANGDIYAYQSLGYRGGAWIKKYSHGFTPIQFSSGKDSLWFPGTVRGGHLRGVRGVDIGPGGDIYVLHYFGYQDLTPQWDRVHLTIFDSAGNLKADSVVNWYYSGAGGGCVRVDKQGDIFVTEHLIPDSISQYSGLTTDEKNEWSALVTSSLYNAKNHVFGSLLRFSSAGGIINYTNSKTRPTTTGFIGWTQTWNGIEYYTVDQMSWIYPFSPTPIGPKGTGCTCFNPRFDMDKFGRLFLPDFAHFRVNVLDNEGNKIYHFGNYGNMDAQGLSYAWPAYLAVTDKAVYVSDMVNRRVVRALIDYQTQGQADLSTVKTMLAPGATGNGGLRVFPNPFDSRLALCYSIPSDGHVLLSIYDISGKIRKTLVDKWQSAGQKQVTWDGTDNTGREMSNGVYFYRFECTGKRSAKKILLTR